MRNASGEKGENSGKKKKQTDAHAAFPLKHM